MTPSPPSDFTGHCLCGAVRFSGQSAGKPVTACHCTQCRRWSGHVWADLNTIELRIEGQDNLRWFRSSEQAERGFCAICGSSLFWRRADGSHVSVSAGAIDAPTGLTLAGHIWTGDKGDYYEIADGLPQKAAQ